MSCWIFVLSVVGRELNKYCVVLVLYLLVKL